MKISFVICDPKDGYKKFGSWLIKYLDGADGSHFAIRKESFTGVHFYESVFPRSKKSTDEEWSNHYVIRKQFDFDVPVHLQSDVLVWLESMMGILYAIPQLFMIAISILCLPLRKILNKSILNHEKALICSELGSRFVETFMKFILEKSHDNTGVKDMQKIGQFLSFRKKREDIWK